MEELLGYVNGSIAKPTDPTQAKRWKKADACMHIILINTMEESVNAQLSHLTSAADIWTEAVTVADHFYNVLVQVNGVTV